PLVQRLERFRPGYALVHTDLELAGAVTATGAKMTELGAWDVYDNSYGKGENVRLYSLTWKRSAQ
ncbi:MAG TPA: hypothetical protein VJV79_27580, partial [Polyangiaceae bacterium]|nr:hypothetical protein [Polyangiaceae bacterium]